MNKNIIGLSVALALTGCGSSTPGPETNYDVFTDKNEVVEFHDESELSESELSELKESLELQWEQERKERDKIKKLELDRNEVEFNIAKSIGYEVEEVQELCNSEGYTCSLTELSLPGSDVIEKDLVISVETRGGNLNFYPSNDKGLVISSVFFNVKKFPDILVDKVSCNLRDLKIKSYGGCKLIDIDTGYMISSDYYLNFDSFVALKDAASERIYDRVSIDFTFEEYKFVESEYVFPLNLPSDSFNIVMDIMQKATIDNNGDIDEEGRTALEAIWADGEKPPVAGIETKKEYILSKGNNIQILTKQITEIEGKEVTVEKEVTEFFNGFQASRHSKTLNGKEV